MKRLVTFIICIVAFAALNTVKAIDLAKATIVYDSKDEPLVRKMANVLADDVERVSGVRPKVDTKSRRGTNVFLSTCKFTKLHSELNGKWESYAIDTDKKSIHITGSDARGLAYGVFHISEAIGVSPWYWFADVPVSHCDEVEYDETYTSKEPTIRYRGLFINDEDWGMKTWASRNFEKDLNDIGPKTYDKVCELILRLRGNMLAPAMHTCTGAFYTHPESQVRAAEWGIMITTSHCEPMLVNNASKQEWDTKRDGEWNYETNSAKIKEKFENRLSETAQYDNIYTTGMRGLHDAAMIGSKDNKVRARTLEKVFVDQRAILEKYKGKAANTVPQIFIPYKEALDIYDAGLKVPEDITLVWPDDNYGYMKRVSNAEERKRSGHSGVYYHISYLGAPHDYLWIPSTAPMLMYEELKKAYDSGADRYWLLNVGDIKPMEIETQQFFDMAYNFSAFNYKNVNRYQAKWLSKIFGAQYRSEFQIILDSYYQLAWQRKPEFMGYEMEWDSKENSRLHDTDFSFKNGTANRRLEDYDFISNVYKGIYRKMDKSLQPALFEMLGYSVLSANQINKKFLYAQRNHETGFQRFAIMATEADDSINALIKHYNSLLDGKWDQMMSELPPAYRAKYHLMPELTDSVTKAFKLPKEQLHVKYRNKVNLTTLEPSAPFRLLEGIGTDWKSLQLGEPLDENAKGSIDIPLDKISGTDSLHLCISVVPMWPIAYEKSNSILVSVDHSEPVTCKNVFKEWGPEWKIQVLENRKEFLLTFPLDKNVPAHTLTLSIGDPGQIVQSITYY